MQTANDSAGMNTNSSVWILDDDRSIRWVLEKSLGKNGLATQSFESGGELLNRLSQETPDAIISDIRMPGIDGLELLTSIQQTHPELPVIIMTAHSDLESAVASYSRGAFEYLPKPFDIDEAVAMTRRALAHAKDKTEEAAETVETPSTEIIGEAPAMQEVFRAIGRLSNSNISVLINGESGTGKELVAHALHQHGPRREQPFVPLNVAAIPKELIESELFGHEKGAFTGATQQRTGRFEQANGGTLFLDEIGDMPAETQTRLLRVLSDGEFYRVGGHTSIKVDVRIIAATHQNLEKARRATPVPRGFVPPSERHPDSHPQTGRPARRHRQALHALSGQGSRRAGRGTENTAPRDHSVSGEFGLAGKRTAAGKFLPLDYGDGFRSRGTPVRPATRIL